jgi:hypothetical protein
VFNPTLTGGGIFGLSVRPDYTGQPVKLPNFSWPANSYNYQAFAPNPTFDGTPGQGLGDVGRNSLRGPGFFQWDLSAMKNFPIREKVTVQFRADFFNILNHPNFANPDSAICSAITGAAPPTPAQCTPNTNFGRVGQTIASSLNGALVGTGTARQEQFSLKITF